MALMQVSQEELSHKILHTWTARDAWAVPIEIAGLDLSITKSIWFLFMGAALTFVILFIGSRILKDRPGAYQVLVEETYGFGRKFLGGQMGEAGRRWMPYTLTIFVFLLSLNLIGLIPNSYPVTANISFTATMAILTFILTQYEGVRQNGPVTYVRTWVPAGLPSNPAVKVPLAAFMWFIHLVTEITRPLALALRLYANILAGHLLIYVFLGFILFFGLPAAIVSVPLALIFYAFEVFVAILQAYIFAILTQVYIELAMYAEEAH